MRNLIKGGKWWKFDIHTHTPASDFTSDGHEITPEKWLVEHMKKKIDCVAVTDHNSGEWIDRLKDAYQELKETAHPDFRQLYIFPSVEISASNNIHILGIFDLD